MIREGLRVERGHKKCRGLALPVTGTLLVSRAGGGGRREEEGRREKGGAWPPVLGLLQ